MSLKKELHSQHTYSTVHLYVASHMHGIFSVALCNFSHCKPKNYTWHNALPRL